MSTPTFNDLPLCASPLTAIEQHDLLVRLRHLNQFLSSPGDWGYGTKLGQLTQVTKALEIEVANATLSKGGEA